MNDSYDPQAVRVGRDASTAAHPVRTSVAISFGSPATESGVTRLDLNDIFIKNPQATYMMRVAGTAMRDDGDIVLVDRAITPAHGHVVIAVVDQELLCRRLVRQGEALSLCPTDLAVAAVRPREGDGFQLWGVVTTVMKSLRV